MPATGASAFFLLATVLGRRVCMGRVGTGAHPTISKNSVFDSAIPRCRLGFGLKAIAMNAIALHTRYNHKMKTATIPPVRIDPLFRKDIEQSLEVGESLASLVETAVRNEVTRRRVQSEFIHRGIAAINRTIAAGDGIPADRVIAKLEAKLAAARSTKKA